MIGKLMDEAGTIYEQYDREMPFVAELAQHCKDQATQHGFLELLDGARQHFTEYAAAFVEWTEEDGPCSYGEAIRRSRTPGHPWFGQRIELAMLYTALNRQIQSDGARQNKMLLAGIADAGLVDHLRVQMHDAVELNVAEPGIAERIAEIGAEVMPGLLVPMPMDVKYGRSWGDAVHKTWDEVPERAAPCATTAPPPVMVDRTVTERFLKEFDPATTEFTFQTFDDNKDRLAAAKAAAKAAGRKGGGDRFAKILHGTFDEHFAELRRRNSQGAGVFITVNRTNFKGRTRSNITEVRWLFSDQDGAVAPPEHADRKLGR
jgi:hypothetical protein